MLDPSVFFMSCSSLLNDVTPGDWPPEVTIEYLDPALGGWDLGNLLAEGDRQ